MARRKIAILGGGIGSLTAAYYLTRTPELRAQNDVTIYQLGWRLGGKCASGRSQIEGQGLRSEEHGLHLWFGFYENAFATLQEVYARRPTRPDDALVTWRDAFEPNSFTPIGEEYNGQLGYWPFVWAQNLDVPGDGRLELTPLGALSQLASILRSLAGDLWSQVDANAESFSERVRGLFEQAGLAFGLAPLLVGLEAIEALGSAGISALADHHRGFDTISHKLREIFQSLAHKHLADSDFRRVYCLFDLGITTLLGLLNPRYGIFEDADFDLDRIDYLDYRAWLLENGGDPWVVNECSYLRALYDLPFAYEDGDVKKPAMGAGTSIRILMRIIFTYKEACFFQMKAGMGEAVIAPYYEVLRAQGVKVEFFRKVRELELSPDKRWVQRVHLERQVDLAGDAYVPTFRVEGLSCWPSEPFWDQIRDGEALRRELAAKKMTLESHWCLHKTGDEVLELGTDFDEVVLGIALGAFKKLNDEPTMCDELYEHSPRFRAMAEGLGLVPTQSFQLWTDPDLAGLGWAALRQWPPAMDAAPEPYSVWADCSPVLAREKWPAGSAPRGVFYFCGPWKNDLTAQPSTRSDVPALALQQVASDAVDWLSKYVGYMWPLAKNPANPAGLDWAVLHDPENRHGVERMAAQYLRPNVDPTECCETSLPNTTRLRLKADESGFENLVLAGAWLRTGLNATCVEAATMSGMDASRALCGEPKQIVGEWFCMKKPTRG